jgi:hypothetical protein
MALRHRFEIRPGWEGGVMSLCVGLNAGDGGVQILLMSGV